MDIHEATHDSIMLLFKEIQSLAEVTIGLHNRIAALEKRNDWLAQDARLFYGEREALDG